jgi:hypothetical protein
VQNEPVEVTFCQDFCERFLLKFFCHLNLLNMTDKQLLQLCELYGRRALIWRRKFMGLLPEVNRRKLFEHRGCSSIFEFAYKVAGLSEQQVRRALNLSYEFRDKPALKELLTNGTVGLSKLARVASIATPENELELAEKVRLLPQKALETLVRDERILESQNGSSKPLSEAKLVRAHTTFELSSELVEELNALHGHGQDVNKILLELLQKRREEIARKKQKLSEVSQVTTSHHIPVAAKRVLQEEFGKKCSIHTCTRPATEIHHAQRFSLASTHDPHYLAPLCKEHHKIAHTIDQKVQNHRHPASAKSNKRSKPFHHFIPTP